MKMPATFFLLVWLVIGCTTSRDSRLPPLYVRHAFVDPSLEVMVAEVTAAGEIEWEGLTIDFQKDTRIGRRMRSAIEQAVGTQIILNIDLNAAHDDLFSLLKRWVLFCEKWRIPYSVSLCQGDGEAGECVNVAFSGRLEGNEILTIRSWTDIELGQSQTMSLSQLQDQLRASFSLHHSRHLEIRLAACSLDGNGPKNLLTLLKQLNANPPPQCWYRLALVD